LPCQQPERIVDSRLQTGIHFGIAANGFLYLIVEKSVETVWLAVFEAKYNAGR
jgi:hypothetical protein